MKSALLAGAAALVIGSPVLAKKPAGPTQSSGSKVIVVLGQGLRKTPGTIAYSTVTIPRREIVDSSSGQLEDVLSNIAGFQEFRRSDSRSSNPTAQGATLRSLGGNATSRALVLLDGVPLADPFFGFIPFSAVAPQRLQSITVTRGGGSGPFGSGALAGTIQLQSASASELGLLSGSALVDQRGETELTGTLAPKLGNGFVELSGQWNRGRGYFTTPVDQRVPASARAAYDSWSASARAVQRLGDLEIQARGLAFNDQRTLRFKGANSASSGRDLSLRVISRGRWKVDALAYGKWRNYSNMIISSTRYVPVLDQKDTPSNGEGGKIEIRPPLDSKETLRLGVDFRRNHGRIYEEAYSAFTGNRTAQHFAGGTNTDLGFFGDYDIVLGQLTLTGGVREDQYRIANGFYRTEDNEGAVLTSDTYANRSAWETTWRMGALYHVDPAVALRAAAYSGFRLPTLNELYRPFVIYPVVTKANAALKSEKLVGYEAGFDLTPVAHMRLSLTAFYNRVENAITNVTLSQNLRQRQNVDAIVAKGVEADGSYTLGSFAFNASLSYTDARVRASGAAAPLNGYRPAQTPAFTASATAAWHPEAGATLSATIRHVGTQYEGDQETDPLPAATTVDLFAKVPLVGQLSAVGRVENLFNVKVLTRNQAGSKDLGEPLTVWLGVRYGF